MLYKAKKQGNGISVTIPSIFCQMLKIKPGDKLEIELDGKKIIVKKEENDVLSE